MNEDPLLTRSANYDVVGGLVVETYCEIAGGCFHVLNVG